MTFTGHSSQTPRIQAGVVAIVAVVTVMLLYVSQATAAGPPEFRKAAGVTDIDYPTRATVGVTIEAEEVTEWKAEYAPAEPDGEAPPENSPAWVIVNSPQAVRDGDDYLFIGSIEPANRSYSGERNTYLRHLAPDTSYYARFMAEDKQGRASETVPFKTLPLGKPEIDNSYSGSGSEPAGPLFFGGANSDTSAAFTAVVEANGSETEYHVEYSLPENGHVPAAMSTSWKPFTSNGSGTITPTEEYAEVEASVAGLSPETTYYVRVSASNKEGEIRQTTYNPGSIQEVFTTLTAMPAVFGAPLVRNVTATSAYLTTSVSPHGSKTLWRLESASSESGPWTPIPGATGTISQVEAEATPYGTGHIFGARFTGLKASTLYYARTVAENECAVGCGSATSPAVRFETSGAPSAMAFAVHGLHGESLRLLGSVNPNSSPTSAEQLITIEGTPTGGSFTLTFEGQSTAPIPYDASAEVVEKELGLVVGTSDNGALNASVIGPAGGPYTVYFGGLDIEENEALIEGDGLALAPPGSVTVVSTQQGGEEYDTHYHFEYVSDKAFAENGWTGAQASPEVDAGSGTSAEYVGYDLPGLAPGETYRYRLVAGNTAPGTSPVESAEQSLTVPVPSPGGQTGACPNEAFRTGLSAHLPDCRAYEMVTPVDKEGAQEPFHYLGGVKTALVVGEDGEHAVLEAYGTNWGRGPGSGQSPYMFSRVEGRGWLMKAGSPLPETGVYINEPEIYNATVTEIAFSSGYSTSSQNESTDIEYKLGPVGGPYQTIASVPRPSGGRKGAVGWVAANGDFSKLVLATDDRTLLSNEGTGTDSGYDLYEYTAGDGLRQLNVSGEQDATIGTCGAKMAYGGEGGSKHTDSGPHSISADGSRVFFEAVAGKSCSGTPNLYMRTDGEETVDIGSYKFAGANQQDSEVLLEKNNEFFLYSTEAGTIKHLFDFAASVRPVISEDLTDIYLNSDGSLYRYDIASETLNFIAAGASSEEGEATPDGHYYYYDGSAGGLPGSGVMRYDSEENTIECISCASPFSSEPKQPTFINGIDGIPDLNGGLPQYTAISANGNFAFLTTPAALVSQDVDGEIKIEKENIHSELNDIGDSTSPSSDVYEWRKNGVDGCGEPQGCLALITDGRGGFYNLLLGTADEGRDVFIYTRSKLLPQDDDTSGDVYDVRIDGGFSPAPPRPVECEGDACSTPPNPPNDATPSSSTFTGAGNVVQAQLTKAAVKSKKPKQKKKLKRKTKTKSKKRGKKAKKGNATRASRSRSKGKSASGSVADGRAK